jgi:integrase
MRRDARSAVEVHLIPHFGDRPVSSITLRDLEGFRAALRSVDGRRGRPVSAKTVYNIEVVLRAVLRWALATGRIQANPADRLPALTRRQRQAPGFENFYLPDQMMLALDALEGHERRMREDKAALPRFRLPWRLILGFLFETGLRVGELAALTKFDVRLAEREVRVSKAVFLGKLQTTKGVNERTVPISPDTAARLERHVARLDPENPLLFPNSDGRYLTSNSFHAPLRWISENVVERTVVAAGVRRELKLKRVSPHAFRHSCGTMLAMADTGEEKIRRHLGHASTSMVQRYVHLAARPDPALNRRLVALIDEARERLRAKARAQGEGNG